VWDLLSHAWLCWGWCALKMEQFLWLPFQDKVGRNLKLFYRSVSTLKEMTVRSMTM
uniref:Uncharacterized protein n=1 Tax=Aegilops tauschii subsp. strangulata TaxID=200361 RepID=A0A453NQG6_AEGTS